LKTSLDSVNEDAASRLVGGGNAIVSVSWRLVSLDAKGSPFTRSNILPSFHEDGSSPSEKEKLEALYSSVIKVMRSLVSESGDSEDEEKSFDDEIQYKKDWLISLFSFAEMHEIEYLLLRISISDLINTVPQLFADNCEFVARLGKASCLVQSRVIKGLQIATAAAGSSGHGEHEQVIVRLLTTSADGRLDQLRNYLNHGGDKYGLVNLIFEAIKRTSLRDYVIEKFSIPTTCGGDYIMSEIDHVVYSPFGGSRWWPEGPIPGFRTVFSALTGGDFLNTTSFLSNKPIAIESWTCRTIREIGMGDAPLLVGQSTKTADLYSVVTGGMNKLQSKLDGTKLAVWLQYRRLFGNKRFVWFVESADFAKALVDSNNGRDQIKLIIVVGDDLLGLAGPVFLDPKIVACSNYVQSAIACIELDMISHDRGMEMIDEFKAVIESLSLNEKKIRNRQLMKQRISDLTFDLGRLKTRLKRSSTQNAPVIDEVVDSVILTPIEALSPCLTNHSPSPGPIGLEPGSYESEIVLSGM